MAQVEAAGAHGYPSGSRPPAVAGQGDAVLVDCDTCSVRGDGCPDCVVTALLGLPGPRVRIAGTEVAALRVLAGSGLVPPLRHESGRPVHRQPPDAATGPVAHLR